MPTPLPPILATADERIYYEWARVVAMDQWWHWFVLAGMVVLLAWLVVRVYRRDAVELPRGIGGMALTFRLVALALLLIYFLDLQKRTEQRVVRNSRAVVIVDTSQSMSLRDVSAEAATATRIAAVTDRMAQLVDSLRPQHDVLVYQVDDKEQPNQVASFLRDGNSLPFTEPAWQTVTEAWGWSQPLLRVATGLALLAVTVWIGFMLLRTAGRDRERYGALLATWLMLAAWIVLAVCDVRDPRAWDRWLGRSPTAARNGSVPESTAPAAAQASSTDAESQAAPVDWPQTLAARGTATRLGDGLAHVVQRERGGPVSGISVISDGNENQGKPLREAAELARDAGIPVFAIGVGSAVRPANVRVSEVDAPARVFPGDDFRVRAFLQATGVAGQSVAVELREVSTNDTAGTLIEEDRVRLGSDDETSMVEFRLAPTRVGRQNYVIQVVPSGPDSDPRDNQRRLAVTVVDRQNRVLLLAGGPMRDYQFLRVQCYRDPEVRVDVLLQGAPSGMAQEADQVLTAFPETLAELAEYDCLVAFDPNWNQLSEAQVTAIDRWIAEQAGGLIVAAGPVYTPEWTTAIREPRQLRTVKSWYPVTFFRRGARLGRDRLTATTAMPLRVTPEGLATRCLQLADDAQASQDAWQSFDGVYGCYPVQGLKPGAVVLASCDTSASSADDPPPYIVSQFYGAGRVLYLGSSEFWRLNEVDLSYFEALTTRLIRYVSEGRLLRDSNRGLLLVDKDRCLVGDQVQVRALLRDAQFRPLEMESAEVTVKTPSGVSQRLDLLPLRDSPLGGTYVGQLVTQEAGDYQLQVVLTEGTGLEVIQQDIQVRLPDLEMESPQRNDRALAQLAAITGGRYFADGLQEETLPELAKALPPRDQESYVPGAPDPAFQQRLRRWFMAMICGCLACEWLTRRWNRLA